MQDYATIVAPLTSLLQNDKFCWTSESQKASENLKHAMTKTPVLTLPNFNDIFVVETDASREGVDMVLLQQNHPIAYFGKKLFPRLQKALAYARELYAVTEAVTR